MAIAGIDAQTLTLSQAIQIHTAEKKKEVRRALRVHTVHTMICSAVDEGALEQGVLAEFIIELEKCIAEMSCDDGNEKKVTTKAIFIKAALMEIEPEKHTSKSP